MPFCLSYRHTMYTKKLSEDGEFFIYKWYSNALNTVRVYGPIEDRIFSVLFRVGRV